MSYKNETNFYFLLKFWYGVMNLVQGNKSGSICDTSIIYEIVAAFEIKSKLIEIANNGDFVMLECELLSQGLDIHVAIKSCFLTKLDLLAILVKIISKYHMCHKKIFAWSQLHVYYCMAVGVIWTLIKIYWVYRKIYVIHIISILAEMIIKD